MDLHHRFDTQGPKFHRLLMDIEDLDLGKLHVLNTAPSVVGVTKHLCGAGTGENDIICMSMHMFVCARVHVCMCVYVFVCLCVCVHVLICVLMCWHTNCFSAQFLFLVCSM